MKWIIEEEVQEYAEVNELGKKEIFLDELFWDRKKEPPSIAEKMAISINKSLMQESNECGE